MFLGQSEPGALDRGVALTMAICCFVGALIGLRVLQVYRQLRLDRERNCPSSRSYGLALETVRRADAQRFPRPRQADGPTTASIRPQGLMFAPLSSDVPVSTTYGQYGTFLWDSWQSQQKQQQRQQQQPQQQRLRPELSAYGEPKKFDNNSGDTAEDPGGYPAPAEDPDSLTTEGAVDHDLSRHAAAMRDQPPTSGTNVTEAALRLWVSKLHNPVNDMVATVIIVSVLQSMQHLVTSLIALFQSPPVHGVPFVIPGANGTVIHVSVGVHTFHPVVCNLSATLTEFFFAAEMFGFVLLFGLLWQPAILRVGNWATPGNWLAAYQLVLFVFGSAAATAMWATLERRPRRSRFGGDTQVPFCWIPAGGPTDEAVLDALRGCCAYAWVAVLLVVAVLAHWSVHSRALRAQLPVLQGHGGAPVPPHYKITIRRFHMQAIVYLVVYGFGVSVRFFPSEMVEVAQYMFVALMGLKPAANALLWAFSEKFERALLNLPHLERAVGHSFSIFATTVLGLAPFRVGDTVVHRAGSQFEHSEHQTAYDDAADDRAILDEDYSKTDTVISR